MDRQLEFEVHPSEGTLEEYCFNRLPESAVETVEEHLFACPSCQDALEDLDEYIQLMKAGTAQCEVAAASIKRTLASRSWAYVRTVKPGPGAVAGLAILCVMAALTVKMGPRPSGTPALDASVSLSAFRGGDDAAVNRAPAGQPLELSIDVTDLPASVAYRVEVVNATGQRIWDATVPASNGKLAARVSKGLNPGIYWIRLYSGPGKLLREFGLRLA